MGPFKITGVIMDESPSGCWTNHQSIVEFKNQWYLFYHHNDLSPKFDKSRSIRIDSLFFNEDGTIKKVKPTLRGVGLTDATSEIQVDRYSNLSESGAGIDFLDPQNTFKGWKAILDKPNAWLSYNSVIFPTKKLKSVQVKASSGTGGTLQIRLDKADGTLIAEVKIPGGNSMSIIDTGLLKYKNGLHNLFITLKDNEPVEVDWIKFIK
jgi:hypothetical protein